jgi:AcrR family transcriptional regulator
MPHSSIDTAHSDPTLPNAKRDQILQGAVRVFLHHGYSGTSMDRAAAEAGVSKQTIYSHFQDKEGLFKALIERMTIHRFQAEFTPDLGQGDPAIVLRRLAETFLSRMDDAQFIAFFRLIIAESARFPELARLYSQTVIQYGYTTLSHYLAQHPDLQISDPEAIARIFFGSLAAFILAQEVLYGKETMPMEKARLVESLVNCILQSGPRPSK